MSSSRRRFLAGLVAMTLVLAMPLTTAAKSHDAKGQPAVPRFVDETIEAGVQHSYEGSWEHFVGGGVAVLDCDGDERPDLYFAGGSAPAALYRNRSSDGGALRFEQLASEATDLTSVTGAYPLDIDSDGVLDLVVLRHGEDVLLRGLGGCGFERANEAWGFEGGGAWTTAFSATFEDGEAFPTLAFGTYIDHVDEQHLVHCGVGSLVRPLADGGFAAPAPLEPGLCALSMLFSDWDRSGRRDLRVSNDRHYYYQDGEEQLWRMQPGEAPTLYTREDGWKRVRIWGMGIASEDLTGDGYPEVYLTSIGSNRLETLAGDAATPTYEDAAYDRGITATTPVVGKPVNPSTSWHPEFDDVNNDGYLDLFVSKGNVDAIPDNALEDPNELFLGRPDGTFRRVARQAGIIHTMRTRGAALVDLNRDGLLDLVEVHRVENVSLRRNVGRGTAGRPRAMGGWLGVKLEQEGPNRDAIGAWIEVRFGGRRMEREVTVGGGHVSGEMGPVHFGIGKARSAEVRVTWPDGEQGDWQKVPGKSVVTIERTVPIDQLKEIGSA
jgi:enediyne biosynthesis protein E4